MKILKNTEVQKRGIISILYSPPGLGKTTLACKQPSSLLLDAEGGAVGIKCDRVECHPSELGSMRGDLENAEYSTIVLDSISVLDKHLITSVVSEFNLTSNKPPITDIAKIPFGGGGVSIQAKYFGFVAWIKALSAANKNVILICHQIVRTQQDMLTGKEFDLCEPAIHKKGAEVLLSVVDSIFYMRPEQSINAEGSRVTSGKVMVHCEPENGILCKHRLPCENKVDRDVFMFPVLK
jgi:hypothetical protein